uniref:Uncharacterized protein LOC117361664 isoform X2 n=1 Tax=Geotrypetes seraphini TaxID=260995 RepID=A0A6P8R0A4_GEOSA|nr:uncharacterized protein LOC117361664 isoform X2 [Geotrypetes seraphini]
MNGTFLNIDTKKMDARKDATKLDNTWICDSPKSNKSAGDNAMIGSQGDSSNGTSVILCEEGNKVFLANSCSNNMNALCWEKNEQREEQTVPGDLMQILHTPMDEGLRVELIGLPLLVPKPPSDSYTFSCCPFPPLTFNRMALDTLKVTHNCFNTPVSSQKKTKKHLTPVMEMDLESISHEAQKTEHTPEGDDAKENERKRDQFPDLFQYDLPISEESYLYIPLYQSCFEAECLEIANKLQCAGSSTRSPSGHGQNRTPKRKQGIVDVSTIENETLPYESTPMKYLLASEEALVLQSAGKDHTGVKCTFFGNGDLDLEKINLQLDVKESVCQVWERRLSEEPLPPSQVLKTLEELPSIEGIGVLGNIQDSASSNSREQEKESTESLEIVATPALNCTLDVQEPFKMSVSAVGKAHDSFNVTLNLPQKLQTDEQTVKAELNQTQLINCCNIAGTNLTVAYEMQTGRVPEMNTTHQLGTVLCHSSTPEGGYQQKTQDDSSSKESNGGFLPDMEHSLSSVKPHSTESTHNESSLSLGSLTFVTTTLMTSTPLQGNMQFQFMKSIYGDSMQKDPNLSVSSVIEERSLDTMVNQNPSCRKVAGAPKSVRVNAKVTVQTPDGKSKLDSIPKTSSLPQNSTRRSLIPRAEIPARSMLPASRRCLTLTIASEEQSTPKDFPLKGRGPTESRPLARQSLGNIGAAFQRSSAALKRQSLAGVHHAGMLCQIKEASLAKIEKLSTIKETDTAPHPNTKPAVPLASRLSKLPGHVSSQLSFGGRVSLGSTPQYKGSKTLGLKENRSPTSRVSSALCPAKLSTTSSNKSSLGRCPAATGRNGTYIRNQTFRPHTAKKTHETEQTAGSPAAETQKEHITLPSGTDTGDDMAWTLTASKEGKGKPEGSARHQFCKECIQKENAKADLLCQLETVKKKLVDREMLCMMHMERLHILETTCESLKMKLHSMETSDDIKLHEETCKA